MTSTDILLPEAAVARVSRTKLAAFLPITLAVAGVAFVLLGGVNARSPSTELAASAGVDPVVTGSIMTPDDRRQALMMLDR
jgi:hypothetical protein